MKDRRFYIWVHSDLQLASPEAAEATLHRAVSDLLEQPEKIDAVWCLGDAVCGVRREDLARTAELTVEALRPLEAPMYYLMGNHEMDLHNKFRSGEFPLHELASRTPSWHVASKDALYMEQEFRGTLAIFLGDHIAKDHRWWTEHGRTWGEVEHYPYGEKQVHELKERIASYKGAVVIASHYAFPGGQRSSSFLASLLPLPKNVALVVHGHAHIGDTVHNPQAPWQRINLIEGEDLPQINISALENLRTPGSHSALLELDDSGPVRLRIRCHLAKEWIEEIPFTRPVR